MPVELYNVGPVYRPANRVSRPGVGKIGFSTSKESPIFPKLQTIGVVVKSANLILRLTNSDQQPIGPCNCKVYAGGVFQYEVSSDSGSFSLLIQYNTSYKLVVYSDEYQDRTFFADYPWGINYISSAMSRKVFAAASPAGLLINSDPANPESNLYL